jgi:hypothetical protein
MNMSPGMNQSLMSSYSAPGNMQSSGYMNSSEYMESQGGWQSADSVMSIPPDQTASMSFGTAPFESGMSETPSPGQEWSFEVPSPTTPPTGMPLNSTPNTAVAPTPDPAFSTAKSPSNIEKVSWSAASGKPPVAEKPSNELPLVEAF